MAKTSEEDWEEMKDVLEEIGKLDKQMTEVINKGDLLALVAQRKPLHEKYEVLHERIINSKVLERQKSLVIKIRIPKHLKDAIDWDSFVRSCDRKFESGSNREIWTRYTNITFEADWT